MRHAHFKWKHIENVSTSFEKTLHFCSYLERRLEWKHAVIVQFGYQKLNMLQPLNM